VLALCGATGGARHTWDQIGLHGKQPLRHGTRCSCCRTSSPNRGRGRQPVNFLSCLECSCEVFCLNAFVRTSVCSLLFTLDHARGPSAAQQHYPHDIDASYCLNIN
jgi:hypothetical protein